MQTEDILGSLFENSAEPVGVVSDVKEAEAPLEDYPRMLVMKLRFMFLSTQGDGVRYFRC